MKAIKILMGIIGGLVALVVVSLIVLSLVFDPNDYKDFVSGKAKEMTGRELVFEGDLELSVFPWIAIKTGSVVFGNAPGFGDEPMVRVKSAEVGLKLLPLLSASIEVGDVAVDGLNLVLMKNAKGVTNWDDLVKGAEDAAEEKSAEESADEAQQFKLSVGGVNITDANISWNDKQAGKSYAVSGANITLGELEPPNPFDFSIALDLSSADPQADAHLEAKGRLAYDMETKALSLTTPEVGVTATGVAVPGGKAEVRFQAANLDANLTNQVLTVREFLFSAYGVEATGTLTGKGFLDNPTLAGDMDVASFNLKDTMDLLGITVPETADADVLSNVSAKLKFTYLPDVFDASELNITLDDTTIRALARVEGFAAPAYFLRASVDAIDVDRYLPPKQEGEVAPTTEPEPEPTTTEGGVPAAEQNLITLIRSLNVNAELTVGDLKASGLHMTDVQVRVLAKDGVLDIAPASLNMYQGNISTTTRLVATGNRLRTGSNVKVDGLEAGPMVRDFVGDKGFEGTVNFQTTEPLTFTGLDEPTAVPSLNGALTFRILDGVFPGVDLQGFLGDAEKLKAQRSGTLQGSPEDRTEFGELAGSATIQNGVLNNQDLCLKAPHLRAGGEGVVDGVKKEVDYLVTAMLIANASGQGGISCDDAVGIGMPVRVSGSLYDPSFGVDAGEFLAMVARGPLRLIETGFGALGDIATQPTKLLDQAIEGLGGIGKQKPASESSEEQPADNPAKAVDDVIKGFGSILGN